MSSNNKTNYARAEELKEAQNYNASLSWMAKSLLKTTRMFNALIEELKAQGILTDELIDSTLKELDERKAKENENKQTNEESN